jgi:hypothetical protein
MARLLSPPVGLFTTSIEPLSGPRAIGSSKSESIGNFTQTVASPTGAWRYQFSFPAMREGLFRRYRGWITALHGGANATRWHFFDPDMMTFKEAGVSASDFEIATGQPWSNNKPWANRENWAASRPNVAVAADADLDETVISLVDVWWGHRLDIGDEIGFFPFYFGKHMVTEVFEPGRYRVWPPLRKNISTGDFATLSATLAMRLESEDAANAGRGLSVADGLTVTMVEVFDYDVRDYFTE